METDTQKQTRKLARLRNRGTRYEVVVARGDERWLVLYTPRKSGRGLRDAVRKVGEALVALTGAAEFTLAGTKALGLGDWLVTFSGRT